MRIISQNGCVSLNFDDIEVFRNGNDIICNTNENVGYLGSYESEERAKEVFNSIHSAYLGYPIFANISDEELEKLQSSHCERTVVECGSDRFNTTIYGDYPKIYKMPKK